MEGGFLDDGSFSMSYEDSGVTADGREVYDNRYSLAGIVDSGGVVTVTSWSAGNSGGNMLYGYGGDGSSLTTKAFAIVEEIPQ